MRDLIKHNALLQLVALNSLVGSAKKRPENQTTMPNPPTSSKLLRFCLMSKVCSNSFAVAYNNKAYGCFQVGDYAKDLSQYDLKTLSTWLNKMAQFTGFPANAARCTSERLEDLCKTELRSTIETSDSPVRRPLPFQSMPTTPDTSHSGTK